MAGSCETEGIHGEAERSGGAFRGSADAGRADARFDRLGGITVRCPSPDGSRITPSSGLMAHPT